jgi:Domain of unknown function (DUF222)/HNH endonuclease
LEPSVTTASDAARFVDLFAELERVSNAGRTIAGRCVETSRVWLEQGYRSPAHWMASHAQTTVAAAITTLETGRQLEELPATRDAFKNGTLSGLQAAEISRAAQANPLAERSLLAAAASASVAGLREQCRSVIAAASRDTDVDERIHRSRYLRHWSEADGAVRVDARLTPDAGARFIATVGTRARRLLEQAKRNGSRERADAYAADALISMLDDVPWAPRAVVHVHVDEAAWRRGRVAPGETCRISGVGPAPVAAARRLAAEGEIRAVLSNGNDIRAVAHLGRTIPARIRTALAARDQSCVVPGCDERNGLEIDHITPLAEGGATHLDNLARLCRWHHSLKTHRGWALQGGPGRWRFFKPRRE